MLHIIALFMYTSQVFQQLLSALGLAAIACAGRGCPLSIIPWHAQRLQAILQLTDQKPSLCPSVERNKKHCPEVEARNHLLHAAA